jgi:hypothetical protein
MLLCLLISVTNFALGYALAIYMGWAKLPQWRRTAAATTRAADPHGH